GDMHKLCFVHESAKIVRARLHTATVCSLATHLLFLVLSALSRFLTCTGEKCRLMESECKSEADGIIAGGGW
ncbi:MAG TPA: hypothetical protein PLN69_07040, partial [bacterium]|nr:hypothetical protein [bacterium]